MKVALRIGIIAAAACVVLLIIWQGVTAHGAPDPTQPNTSPTVAFLDIGVLVFREGLECILVLAQNLLGRMDPSAQSPQKKLARGRECRRNLSPTIMVGIGLAGVHVTLS